MTDRKKYLFDINSIIDVRGNLSIIEGGQTIPFEIKRIYYLSKVPVGAGRGGHAHLELEQVIISISGSFDVILKDGADDRKVTLNSEDQGLYVGPMTWRELSNFSHGAICLVLASEHYDPDDYIFDYDEFLSRCGAT
ncbi:sugar 3,4-ketoisomerase [Arenicellales bacterium IMCC55707]